ncbi:MAG: threonine synthase [Thermodesulfobacteriota bacterium]
MRYISTRGGVAPIPFSEAVLMGLATDGGLLLPTELPEVPAATLAAWRQADYPTLAAAVLGLFATDLPAAVLRDLVDRSYRVFRHPAVTPVVPCGDLFILELFHGPTLAFKDVALQLLGHLFEHLLAERGGRLNILGATSGDTGSAAIHGVRGRERIAIFILHPQGRVSRIQELQMTTVLDANVHNIAVKGTFDDGQAIVKAIFGDLAFKERHQLGAINSINWARVLAQVVYYLYAAFRVQEETAAAMVDFSVPTGNFGDIFAGHLARKLAGGAIGRLILATNANNILARFVQEGVYAKGVVTPTISPSMDIQVASNFERYLYDLLDEDPRAVTEALAGFAARGSLAIDSRRQERVRQDFAAAAVSEEETLATIRKTYAGHGYLVDPHTAVGVAAGRRCRRPGVPLVCLATAHPAKFGEAVTRAIGEPPPMPPALEGLAALPSRCQVLPADAGAVKAFLAARAI